MLIFITKTQDQTIKSRHCTNGSTQQLYMDCNEVTSPMVSTEVTLITATIEAKEERDVATCDIPNAFIQTLIQGKDKTDRDGNLFIMKI